MYTLKNIVFLRSESESFLVEIKTYSVLISQAVSCGQGVFSKREDVTWGYYSQWGLQGADSRLFKEAFSLSLSLWSLFTSDSSFTFLYSTRQCPACVYNELGTVTFYTTKQLFSV